MILSMQEQGIHMIYMKFRLSLAQDPAQPSITKNGFDNAVNDPTTHYGKNLAFTPPTSSLDHHEQATERRSK